MAENFAAVRVNYSQRDQGRNQSVRKEFTDQTDKTDLTDQKRYFSLFLILFIRSIR